MKIVNTAGASSLMHPVHGAFDAADGVFDVPPELADELLRFPAWSLPTEVVAARDVIDVDDLYDPLHSAEQLALLREDVAVLRAGGQLEPAETPPGPWAPDARTTAWIGMCLRGDRDGIAAWTALTHEIAELQARAAADKAKAEAAAAQSVKPPQPAPEATA